MVFNGQIFHGPLNSAGEFGHQLVEFDGNLCNCGRVGCLEAHAGGLAIVRQANERISGIHELLQKTPTEVGVDDVYQLAQEGNAQARQLTDTVVKYIGMGLVNLINLSSVELICISGGISNAPSELLLDPLIQFVRSRAYISVADKVQICKSNLGEDAPLVGAALLYRETSHLVQEATMLDAIGS
jgi:glucokinase